MRPIASILLELYSPRDTRKRGSDVMPPHKKACRLKREQNIKQKVGVNESLGRLVTQSVAAGAAYS